MALSEHVWAARRSSTNSMCNFSRRFIPPSSVFSASVGDADHGFVRVLRRIDWSPSPEPVPAFGSNPHAVEAHSVDQTGLRRQSGAFPPVRDGVQALH